MTKAGSEERYPLLLLYVEENGRKSEFPQRVVFADKGRGNSVTLGAAAIITQWPGQITSCWLTSVTLVTAFIFISLLLLISVFNPLSFPIHPRCAREVNDNYGNRTIHLVKHGNSWSHRQLDILRFIADNYQDFEIRILMLEHAHKNFEEKKNENETAKTHFYFHLPDITTTFLKKLNDIVKQDTITDDVQTTKIEKHEEPKKAEDSSEENDIPENQTNNSFRRTKRAIRFFRLPNTYDDILRIYPNIREQKITYKEYFVTTPLHYFWVDYSPEMILYSVRVLELWQNGGISFYIPTHEHDHRKHERSIDRIQYTNTSLLLKQIFNKTTTLPKNPEKDVNIARLKLLISSTKYRYEKLTNDLVSIDGQGLHMATKIPCHSFFGEMIIKLQKDISYVTVPDFIQRILNLFCGRGAVDSEYCMKKKK